MPAGNASSTATVNVGPYAGPRAAPQDPAAGGLGQLPSSHSPAMGSAAAVSSRISSSAVKSRPHRCRTAMVKLMARRPITAEQPRDTTAAARARAGRPAPSSFPTRVETPG
ncbi:unnamed protein product [Spirodela intermedia]|uniref:Uncharacterized protein n=1 Tax=Spirodela intermedia TaxID=51605 RepID=A0A7I8I7X9_SPIIN|nr:unnamed protein product [Spirodela intermedia]CAA6653503.1 unnamed protein product [Spirodela intermedia]